MQILEFETARSLAQMAYERNWNHPGNFMVETYGWEDAEHFNVVIGSRQWLRDNNADYYPPADDKCVLVRKDNGAIEEENPLFIMDKLNAMDPVGVGHPIDEDVDDE